MVKLIVLIALLSCTLAVTQWGRCPAVTYKVQGIALSQYLGTWYEQARASDMPFEAGNCQQAHYSLLSSGNVKVNNTQISNGQFSAAIGTAFTTSNPNQLLVSFTTGFASKITAGDYEVIDTDYKSYALVYSCTSFLGWSYEYFWVLSRTPQLDSATFQRLISYTQSTWGFTNSQIYFTKQDAATCGN